VAWQLKGTCFEACNRRLDYTDHQQAWSVFERDGLSAPFACQSG